MTKFSIHFFTKVGYNKNAHPFACANKAPLAHAPRGIFTRTYTFVAFMEVINVVSGTVLCNNILIRAFQENIKVNPRKLQKLMYYIALDYLHERNEMLFYEPFAPWEHGPVLHSVYEEFKWYDSRTIVTFARDSIGNVPIVDEAQERDIQRSIDAIWQKYKAKTGDELTALSHSRGSAWDCAMQDGARIITQEYMQREIELIYGRG